MGTLTFNNDWGDGAAEFFSGDIVYAEAFRATTTEDINSGVIIIQYHAGHELEWRHWINAPSTWAAQGYRYPDKKFYGLYYIDLHADGNQVFIAQTNDQRNAFGPTETATLAEAKAKFTKANLPNLLDLSVGDPQTRYP
jgi:hypothetical protein